MENNQLYDYKVCVGLFIYKQTVYNHQPVTLNNLIDFMRNFNEFKDADRHQLVRFCGGSIDYLEDFGIIERTFDKINDVWMPTFYIDEMAHHIFEKLGQYYYNLVVNKPNKSTIEFIKNNFSDKQIAKFDVKTFVQNLPQIEEAEKYSFVTPMQKKVLSKGATFDYQLTQIGRFCLRENLKQEYVFNNDELLKN